MTMELVTIAGRKVSRRQQSFRARSSRAKGLGSLFSIVMVICALLPGSGQAQANQVELTEVVKKVVDGVTIITYTFVDHCLNTTWRKAACGICLTEAETQAISAGVQGGDSSVQCAVGTYTGSFIDNFTHNYHHYATDFSVGRGSAGCSSCGGGTAGSGGVPELFLERRHRFRNLTEIGSFGPGVYSNYDAKVFLHPQTGGGFYLTVFDPREIWSWNLEDGTPKDGGPADGNFSDPWRKSVQGGRMLDEDEQLTTKLDEIETFEITAHNGYVHLFEAIQTSDDVVVLGGLSGRWKFNEASGAAFDASGNGNSGMLNGAARSAGYSGRALTLDGMDDYVDLNSPAALKLDAPLTFSAWVKVEETDGIRTIFSHYNDVSGDEVFLRIHDNEYEVGSTIGGTTKVAAGGNPTDDKNSGKWVHIAGYIDGSGYRLYLNGLEIDANLTASATNLTTGKWAIGAQGGGGADYFKGQIDDARVYSRKLTAGDIAALAQPPEIAGRLIEIRDRNGYKIALTYRFNAGADGTQAEKDAIAEAPDRQWQIKTITDANGRAATFSYETEQVGGLWVVKMIDLPNKQHIDYTYVDGHIAKVEHPDGTTSTFTYTVDTHTTQIGIEDAAATGTHRRKTAYLTNNYVTVDGKVLHNQSTATIRMLVNGENKSVTGEGEVAYLNVTNPNGNNSAETAIYEGAGRMKLVNGGWSVAYYDDGWKIRVEDNQVHITGNLESTHPVSGQGWVWGTGAAGTYPSVTDAQGRTYACYYDDDSFPIQKNYPADDGGSVTIERTEYDPDLQGGKQFHLVTRHEDRLGRVTEMEYDDQGNLLFRRVGIVNTHVYQKESPDLYAKPNDFNQPEHATYVYTYYSGTESVPGVVAGLLTGVSLPTTQPANLLKMSEDARKNKTFYVYNGNNLLTHVIEPDDANEGYHVAAAYTYEDAEATARRLETSTDAVGRQTEYFYDERDRIVQIQYHDGSTERTAYGNDTDKTQNLVVARQDRNGNVLTMEYDDHGRLTLRTTADYTISQADLVDETETDLLAIAVDADHGVNIEVQYTCTYLEGTNLTDSCTNRGETTENTYDYRQRVVGRTTYPRNNTPLTTITTYLENLPFSVTDPYGRTTYNHYRTSDAALDRTVRFTHPDSTSEPSDVDGDFDDVKTLSRGGTSATDANAEYLITDYDLDAARQTVATIDPRGIVHGTQFDSRGRRTISIQAATDIDGYTMGAYHNGLPTSGLPTIAAKSQTVYDVQSNVIESYSPRYFASAADVGGSGKAYETFEYTRRNLQESHTTAAGATAYVEGNPQAVKVTEEFTYYLDRRAATTVDYRKKTWTRAWHACCGRFQGSIDPLGYGTISNTDFYGNVTHTAVVSDMPALDPATGIISDGYNPHAPPEGQTLNETTTRYDARHRPIATTRWLVPLTEEEGEEVDAQNPPIAGLNDVPKAHGLTTQYLYAENLTDADLTVQRLGGDETDTYTISIADLIKKLEDDSPLTTFFAIGSDGSATVVINPEEEISVSIQDGLGRTVATGILDPVVQSENSPVIKPITWSTTHYDVMKPATGFGKCLETVRYDALDNITKSRTDGAGRTLEAEEIEDAVKYITTISYDNNGNRLSVRDPNSVGWDAGTALGTFDGYDNRNRLTDSIDTQTDKSSTVYDKNNNVTVRTDAFGKTVNCTFDARNRRVSCKDRILATTSWSYDQNNNLLSIKDGENQTTSYTYDKRNLNTEVTWPDHTGGSPGDSNYGITTCSYDAAGRRSVCTDQLGDTCTYKYDLANRLLTKEYPPLANNPSITDIDTFTYDAASRMLTAISQRYTNTVTLTYDDVGRTAREKLDVAGQIYSLLHAYDDASRPITLTYPDGTVVDRTYTERNQLANIKYQSAAVATFTYDAGMRETQRKHGNNIVTTRAYRKDNLTQSITTTVASGLNFGYTYDVNKNKLTESISVPMDDYGFGTTTATAYDNEDRLTGWTRDDGNQAQLWTLSSVGDWSQFKENSVTETRTHGKAHELNMINAIPLIHDAKGNITTNSNGQTYAWDFDNRMREATVGANTHNYEYDALGRRVAKHVMTGGGTAGQAITTTIFVSSGQQVVSEYQHTGTLPSITSTLLRKYTYGSYIDEPVLLIDLTAAGSSVAGVEELFYYHTNNLYSVQALTDSSGNIVERYAYDAYGNTIILAPDATTPRTVSSYSNPYMYTGRRLDEETGLYYYRARYYDAALGRFISRDPIFHLNLYAYVGNRPLVALDPSGMDPSQWNQFPFIPGELLSPPSLSDLIPDIRLPRLPKLPRFSNPFRREADPFIDRVKNVVEDNGFGWSDEVADNWDEINMDGVVVTIDGLINSESRPDQWNQIPELGGAHLEVSTIDELIDILEDRIANRGDNVRGCVSTVLVNAHGLARGSQLGNDDFTSRDISNAQLRRIKDALCDDAVVIIATCHNHTHSGPLRTNMQDFADRLGTRVCTCPGRTSHYGFLRCKRGNNYYRMMCVDPN